VMGYREIPSLLVFHRISCWPGRSGKGSESVGVLNVLERSLEGDDGVSQQGMSCESARILLPKSVVNLDLMLQQSRSAQRKPWRDMK
jgi:hypothetical protein